MKRLKVSIIGLGYWGPNYLRLLNQHPECEIVACCDLNLAVGNKIQKQFPHLNFTQNYKDLVHKYDSEAVIIVTPVSSHFELADYFLSHKKHVFIEKPFVQSLKQARSLHALAEQNKFQLMAGHIYIYNQAIQKLKSLINEGEFGDILYVKSDWSGMGTIFSDGGALWEITPHNFSILYYLFEEKPVILSAIAHNFSENKVDDYVCVNMKFPKNNVVCSTTASWFSPERTRKLIIVGSRGMAIFDDVSKDAPLKVIHREKKTTTAFQFEDSEPLKAQLQEFIDSIKQNRPAVTDSGFACAVTDIMEQAQEMAALKGTSS